MSVWHAALSSYSSVSIRTRMCDFLHLSQSEARVETSPDEDLAWGEISGKCIKQTFKVLILTL